MKQTPITRLAATFGALTAIIGLLFLAACSAAEPAPTETVPATAPVANSPLPSPTPRGVADSPPPSPTPAADEASPTVAEVVSGEPAPDFTLESAQGGPITLSDYQRGTSVSSVEPSNVVLVFYRGQT